MNEFDPTPPADDPQLPPALQAAIRQLYQSDTVPRELDEQILLDARQNYRSRQRQWDWIRGIGAGLAAAAAIAMAVRVFMPADRGPTASASHPQLAEVADVNHDGRVDILDAYTVARHIARHDPLDRAWDINGDGVVDQKDVDLIANMAVQTSREARQ